MYAAPFTAEHAAQEIDRANAILDSSDSRKLNRSFEKFFKKRHYEQAWYRAVGGQSVRAISDDLKRVAEYDMFYSLGSEIVHGASYGGHLALTGSRISIRGIRGLYEFPTVFTWSVIVILRTIETVLGRYRPGELQSFRRKYIEQWRGPFRSVPALSFEPTQVSLDSS